MLPFPIDVPAHVQHAPVVENHVQVDAGTNWDLSRAARVSPIVILPDPLPTKPPPGEELTRRYMPNDGIPEGDPAATLGFGPEGTILTQVMKKDLLKLPKTGTYAVAAHASWQESDPVRLSVVRAKVTTAYLRSKGYKVLIIKPFSGDRPVLPGTPVEGNRNVEVFNVPAGSILPGEVSTP
jgi:hypothetical protein